MSDIQIEKVKILAEHYQKTFEWTVEMWKLRNRTFWLLVGVVVFASALVIPESDADSLFANFVANIVGIQGRNRINELTTSPLMSILKIALPLIVAYLMVNLYQKTYQIKVHYIYLEGIEEEIRKLLGPDDLGYKYTFQREGVFYENYVPRGWKGVGWIYGLIVLSLLVLFFMISFATEVARDQQPEISIISLIVHIVGLGATLWYFWLYVNVSK